jgi:hypothetical protein
MYQVRIFGMPWAAQLNRFLQSRNYLSIDYPDWTNWEWNLAGSDRKKGGTRFTDTTHHDTISLCYTAEVLSITDRGSKRRAPYTLITLYER